MRLRAEEEINSHSQRELDLRISTLEACEPDAILIRKYSISYRSIETYAEPKPADFYIEPLSKYSEQKDSGTTRHFRQKCGVPHHQSIENSAYRTERLSYFYSFIKKVAFFVRVVQGWPVLYIAGRKRPLISINRKKTIHMTQELLHKYFKGNATVEEEKRILNWVDESEENRKALQKERMLFDIALFTDTKTNRKREKAAMGTRILPMLRWSARIAAVIVVAISCGFLFKEYHYGKTAHLQTVAVPAGQRAQITLADGTRVWLNAQSTLSYSHDFGRNERDVELDGEATLKWRRTKRYHLM